MTKVVVNRCYGGFGLSKQAVELYAERKGLKAGDWNDGWGFFENGEFYDREIPRDDPTLVGIVEELGAVASSQYSDLKVVDVPDDVIWTIEEYDGSEWVAEVHRRW
jgi:hypothetical protein